MLLLALATENAELRALLAETQDQCVELAVDAGELHAEVEALQRELAEIRAERSPLALALVDTGGDGPSKLTLTAPNTNRLFVI